MEHAHPIGVDQRHLVFNHRGAGALEIGHGRIAGDRRAKIRLGQVLALEFFDQANALEMVGPARGDRHIVHPGRKRPHLLGEAGPALAVDGVLHEVLAHLLGVAQRAPVGAVAEHPAERVLLVDDAADQALDILHIAPLQPLGLAEQLGHVLIGDQLALPQFHDEADGAAQILIINAVLVGDLAPVGDLGPVTDIHGSGTAAGRQILGMAEGFANIFLGLVRLVALDFVPPVAGNITVGGAHLGVFVVFLDPVIGANLFAPEQRPLVVAPEVAADPLVHLHRSQRAAPLEAVAGLVGVDLVTEIVRPVQQSARVIDLDAQIALHGDSLEVLGAHDRPAAAAGVNPPAVRDHAGNTDLVLTGLADGQGMHL